MFFSESLPGPLPKTISAAGTELFLIVFSHSIQFSKPYRPEPGFQSLVFSLRTSARLGACAAARASSPGPAPLATRYPVAGFLC